jgi:methionyl-tRNA formyltransferase
MAFFGGEPLGAPTLQVLIEAGYRPDLVVCNPDRPAGRGRTLTPPPVKVLAEAQDITIWQPDVITPDAPPLQGDWDVCIVVAYNKILPQWLIELPKHKTINVHPSLLPKLRGASPIRSAILRDEPKAVGVSIMQMDTKMDHGPILAQEPHAIAAADWPLAGPVLDQQLIERGARLLVEILPRYLRGEISAIEQDHDAATYCGRLTKEMAEINLDPHNLPTGDAARAAYRTIQAFAGIGNAWFTCKGTRYKIKTAHLVGERLVIDTVVPAGKPEQRFTDVFGH